MAESATTHVLEIEEGRGEPRFIPLRVGHELQPLSIGMKGMWKIDAPRVLDVHAFVYFDGHALFLQSANEREAASVDGQKVGKAWTELHAPCTIDLGVARLRFRCLLAEATPGEFSSDGDDESTRVAPMGSVAAGAAPQAPRSAAPVGEIRSGADSHAAPPQSVRHAAMPQGMPAQPYSAAGFVEGLPRDGSGNPGPGISVPPGTHGSLGPSAEQRSGLDLAASWHALSVPKRVLVVIGPFAVLSAMYLLLVDDDPQPRRSPVATREAGPGPSVKPSSTVAAAPPTLTVWPPNVPCPPPDWPPGTPLPCSPNSAVVPTPRDAGQAAKPRDLAAPKDAAAPLFAGTRTLERLAVDYISSGDYGKAEAAYEELARHDPNNRAYAEAARILRAKLDAGAP